jgi:hypothetical protein
MCIVNTTSIVEASTIEAAPRKAQNQSSDLESGKVEVISLLTDDEDDEPIVPAAQPEADTFQQVPNPEGGGKILPAGAPIPCQPTPVPSVWDGNDGGRDAGSQSVIQVLAMKDEISGLKAKLNNANAQVEELVAIAANAAAQVATLSQEKQAKAHEHQETVANIQREKRELLANYQRLTATSREVEKQKEAADARIAELEQKVTALANTAQSKLEAEVTARKEAEERAAKAEDMVEKLEAYVKQQDANSAEAAKEAKAARETAESLNQQLTESNTRSAQLLLDLSNAHAAAETMRIQKDAELEKLNEANDEVQRLTENLIAADEALAEKNKVLNAKDKILSQMNEALAEKDQALAKKDQALAEKDDQIKSLMSNSIEKKVQHPVEDGKKKMRTEIATLKNQLKQSKENSAVAKARHDKAYGKLEKEFEAEVEKNQHLRDEMEKTHDYAMEMAYAVKVSEEHLQQLEEERRGKQEDAPLRSERQDQVEKRKRDEEYNNINNNNQKKRRIYDNGGGDLREELRRRSGGSGDLRDELRRNQGNGSSRERSLPPTTFQEIYHSQQALPAPRALPVDTRTQHKEEREDREEGELRLRR